MGIDAVALLRGKNLALPSGVLSKTLEDGVLVFTHDPFSADLEEMGLSVRRRVGAALDAHDDPRGVFILPDVAHPRASTYEGVVDEIGEIGVWAPVLGADHVPASMANATPGSMEALMGQMMGALGGDPMAVLVQAAQSGDPAALAAAQQRLVEALGGEDKLADLERMFGEQAGSDFADGLPDDEEGAMAALAAQFPDFDPKALEAITKQLEAQLDADPELAAQLAAQVKGLGPKPKG